MSSTTVWAAALASTMVVVPGCSNGDDTRGTTAPEPLPSAFYVLTAQILGPVQHDDDADMEFTLVESKGVSADLNFVRMTCSRGSSLEWGADDFDSNRVLGGTSFVFVRHYQCQGSGRPREVLIDLTDDNGYHHQVVAAPFHPDWPGA